MYFTQEQADTATKAIIIKSKQFPFIYNLISLFYQKALTNQSNPKKLHIISPDNLLMNTQFNEILILHFYAKTITTFQNQRCQVLSKGTVIQTVSKKWLNIMAEDNQFRKVTESTDVWTITTRIYSGKNSYFKYQ